MSDELTMTPLSKGERSRTYHFGDGKKFTISEVKEILVRPSGTHRLRDGKGKLWIVTSGWLAIEIDADEWSI